MCVMPSAAACVRTWRVIFGMCQLVIRSCLRICYLHCRVERCWIGDIRERKFFTSLQYIVEEDSGQKKLSHVTAPALRAKACLPGSPSERKLEHSFAIRSSMIRERILYEWDSRPIHLYIDAFIAFVDHYEGRADQRRKYILSFVYYFKQTVQLPGDVLAFIPHRRFRMSSLFLTWSCIGRAKKLVHPVQSRGLQ